MLSQGRKREFGRRKEPHRIIIAHGDVVQDFTVRPWVFSTLLTVGILFSVLYLAATTYLVFRDEIISFSRTEQALMQSAYEDRIAELRTQLDRVASRQMIDQQEIETHVKYLMRKQADYEAHSSVLGPILSKAKKAGVQIRTEAAVPIPRTAPFRLKKTGPDQANAAQLPAASKKIAQARVTSSFQDLAALGFRSSTTLDSAKPSNDSAFELASAQPLGLDAQTSTSIDIAEQASGKRHPTIMQLADAANRLDTEMHDNSVILTNILSDVRSKTARVERRIAALGIKLKKPEASGIGGPFVPLSFNQDPNQLAQNAETVAIALDRFMQLKRNVSKLPLAHPLPTGRLTSPFGARRDPFLKRMAMHAGIDVAHRYGTPIRASGDGKVTHAGVKSGYGYMVEIKHSNGVTSRYAHMSKVLVKKGAVISKGTIVGKVGSSGRSTGPHLHFETRIKGKPVNPSSFLLAGQDLRKMI